MGDANTEVFSSCAATLNGNMYVLGGQFKKKQMSMIEDCSLKDIGELSFEYFAGGCNTFTFGIMLCFAKDADSTCHSFNGATTKEETPSNVPHRHVRSLGNYKNSPFVTGHDTGSGTGSSTYGLKTEILNYSTSTWVQADDYPYSNTNKIG